MSTRADLLRGPGTHDPIGDAELDELTKLEHATERRAWLARRVDITGIPDELLDRIRLSPQLYNPTTKRLEFQRTPNLFPSGRIVFAGAGAIDLDAATQFGAAALGPQDVDPTIKGSWRLLGGVLFASVAVVPVAVAIRRSGSAQIYAAANIPAAGSATITLPGNGSPSFAVQPRRSLEIFASVAVTIDFLLFVAEESA